MNTATDTAHPLRYMLVLLISSLATAQIAPQAKPNSALRWTVVVNNGVVFPSPGETRLFNSYNQPSINLKDLVVLRARSKGGTSGEPAHGVLTRDMSHAGTPLTIIFDRTTAVPQPNNLGSLFIEPPSFPRIDMYTNTIASRGNHQPVWRYTDSTGADTRAGTTGIYTNPFGPLVSGANNLGAVPGFDFFSVPGGCTSPGTEPRQCTKFDVFPGAPAVTDGNTIVFKGNFTTTAGGKTGVYFRTLTNDPIANPIGGLLEPAGGSNPVVLIADSNTYIPGTSTRFGSTAPPSAAKRDAVFSGFDNEDAPTLGGIYLAHLTQAEPNLIPLVTIGSQVPGESGLFNKLGEGLSFDGRFVAFWGAWGTETKTLTLQCPDDGNKDRLAFCQATYPNGFTTTVPLHQGIFIYDTGKQTLTTVAKTPDDFDDFVYWNFSGLVPGTGESDETGEPARWRSAEFVAVSGMVDSKLTDPKFSAAFKARKGQITGESYVNPVDGIYIYNKQPDNNKPPTYITAVYTGMPGTLLDPQAVFVDTETPGAPPVVLPVTEMGLERDGFRGSSLVINASMGTEEAGWAGIYLTTVPK